MLVHGIASSTANWDFSRTWSTARALATAGYVVYSYDRLGYVRSSYFDMPGGGATLTTREQRRMLHQVAQDVTSGGYSTSVTDDCVAATPGGMRNPTVAILGHSAGGWIVAGYPGTYHDVAAMIQTSIFATTDGFTAPSDQRSQGDGFDPNPDHPDYFDFFHQRSDCESFNVYAPGAVQSVVDIACTPPFIPSPYGEIADLAAKLAENDVAISQIGAGTPVLLAAGGHDTTASPEKVRVCRRRRAAQAVDLRGTRPALHGAVRRFRCAEPKRARAMKMRTAARATALDAARSRQGAVNQPLTAASVAEARPQPTAALRKKRCPARRSARIRRYRGSVRFPGCR